MTAAMITMFGRPGHTMYVDRVLMPSERASRTWTCSCGWTTTGYDNTAKTAASRHVREATR